MTGRAAHNADFDVLVIGGGLAGMASSLHLAEAGLRVGLLLKKPFSESSSSMAQGGIAAAVGNGDAPALHAEDTHIAGAGLCHADAVDFVTAAAPEQIAWLMQMGADFTGAGGHGFDGLHLSQEGGHSRRRVVHAADATGREVSSKLAARVRGTAGITILENRIAIDLIMSAKLGHDGENRCLGTYALNRDTGHVETLTARQVVLASGGASKVYLYTTNPDTSTGDGIAMAWRAGCRIANMEFVQFHPTCLFHPHAKSVLVSEAVRGEGGYLRLPDGTRFMPGHDERAELAPRDIVARAIDYEMKRGGFDCVYLDISHKPAAEIREMFPNISARCEEFGIDMTASPIPVVPAAHYTCGGVITDLAGATDLAGLYAVGEATFTGLHGANRLASNSLLECLVFARAASRAIADAGPPPRPAGSIPAWDESRVTNADEQIVVSHNWEELRRFMWNYVGIVRTDKRLKRAYRRVELLQEEIHEYYSNFRVTNDLIELRNLALVADLTIRSALSRTESRGLHYTLDYPETHAEARDTILSPA